MNRILNRPDDDEQDLERGKDGGKDEQSQGVLSVADLWVVVLGIGAGQGGEEGNIVSKHIPMDREGKNNGLTKIIELRMIEGE